MPTWMALSFQDSSSPSMEQLLYFHDHSMIVLILVTILTLYLLISFALSKVYNKFLMEGQEIESIWTVIPGIFLLFIALPSLKTLYLMEDTKTPSVTIKVNGHQWYWEYEYTSMKQSQVEEFMENSNTYRLLKTSSTVYIPIMATTRALITSMDVIHSWAMPSMGVKVDALPGRLNQTFVSTKRLGLFSGQCSEICGMNHSFMPILLQSLTPPEFIKKMKEI